MRIAVIMPAYNEEKYLPDLINEVKKYVEDIIVVDDGSYDNTFSIAKSCGVEVLRHEVNRGKGAACRTGLDFALSKNYDYVILMDADGQHSPDDLPKFLKEIEKREYDLIIGKRNLNTNEMPFIRYMTNRLTSLVTSLLSHQKVEDSQSGYRAVKMSSYKKIELKANKYDIESEMIIKMGRLGLKIKEIPVKTIYAGQKSYINPVIDTLRFLRLAVRSLLSG